MLRVRRQDIVAHIIVELSLLSTDHGGRKSPVSSGYRPQFYYDGQDWDASHEYSIESLHPGQSTNANLTFFEPKNHIGRLYPSQAFLIREGNRVVGYGRVLEVCDVSLLRHNRYLYVFGYCTPTQWSNNTAHGWDDEDSSAVFIEAPTEHDALLAGRIVSERSVRRMFLRHRWFDGGPSWSASSFAHWIEKNPLDRFSGMALESLPVVRWNELPCDDELMRILGMVAPKTTE